MTGMIKWLQGFVGGSWGHAIANDDFSQIDVQLKFGTSDTLTLGVEFELALLDRETLLAKPCGEELIAQINHPNVKKELFRHMVEVTTGICKDVHDAKAQISEVLCPVIARAEALGAVLIGSGRPPTLKCSDLERVEDVRYSWLKEQRQIINDRFGTLGMHIHLGMPDAEILRALS